MHECGERVGAAQHERAKAEAVKITRSLRSFCLAAWFGAAARLRRIAALLTIRAATGASLNAKQLPSSSNAARLAGLRRDCLRARQAVDHLGLGQLWAKLAGKPLSCTA